MLKNIAITIIGLSYSAAAQAADCKPSKWGAQDEIGAANHITPSSIKDAAKLIKQGKSAPLGIVVEPGMPAFPPRFVNLNVHQPNQTLGRKTGAAFGWNFNYNDDSAQLWFGVGPQIDGLSHFGDDGVFYNCNKAVDFIEVTGAKKMGIEGIPPLVGRGVLINMAKHFKVASMEAGQGITPADVDAAIKAQDIKIKKGDIILFHTGWTDEKLKKDPKTWASVEPGLTNAAAQHVANMNPMVVGSDTWGLGPVPPVKGDKVFFDHAIFLKEHGIYILENIDTGVLAKENVKEFMFVLGQARVKGAVQMIINPVAMW
jgi:kynurenine formamidase